MTVLNCEGNSFFSSPGVYAWEREYLKLTSLLQEAYH
jgi:hypothetical protein